MTKIGVYTSFSFMLDTFDVSFRSRYPDDHVHLITFRDHPKRVFERIKEETAAGEPSADLVIAPHWMVLNMQLSGLLRPYDSPEFEFYKKEYYDARAAWCAMALSPVGMVYNTDLVKGEAIPETLDDALSERWRGKLATHEITNNVEGQMGLTYLSVLEREIGNRRWNGVVDRIAEMRPTMYQCMPEMALNVGLGKSYLGLPATHSCVAYYLDVQNRPVNLKMPTDIPYMMTFAPSIALVRGGENPEWAERAFDFALSEEWQSRVESFGGKIPTRNGLTPEGAVPEKVSFFPTLEDAKSIPRYKEALLAKIAA
jgi:ABC-type Fe3+ transport system substrate-binding protein